MISKLLTLVDRQHVQQVLVLVLGMAVEQAQVRTINTSKRIYFCVRQHVLLVFEDLELVPVQELVQVVC